MKKLLFFLVLIFNVALGEYSSTLVNTEEVNLNYAESIEIQSTDIPDIPSVH